MPGVVMCGGVSCSCCGGSVCVRGHGGGVVCLWK